MAYSQTNFIPQSLAEWHRGALGGKLQKPPRSSDYHNCSARYATNTLSFFKAARVFLARSDQRSILCAYRLSPAVTVLRSR